MVRPSLPDRVAPAVGDQLSVRCERPSGVGHRTVPDVVEDDVVALVAVSEVLLGVVDDVVGADRADQLNVLGAAHSGHLGAENLGDLHSECADPARGPVDQDLLPGPHLRVVAKELERGAGGHADGGGLFEGEIGRLRDELILGCPGVLGEGAGAPTEHLVARA